MQTKNIQIKAKATPGKRPTGYETGAQTAYADFGRR